jgi:hypothetical protein
MLNMILGFEPHGEHTGIMSIVMTLIAQLVDAVTTPNHRRSLMVSFSHRPVEYHGMKSMAQDMLCRILLGSDYFELVGNSKARNN